MQPRDAPIVIVCGDQDGWDAAALLASQRTAATRLLWLRSRGASEADATYEVLVKTAKGPPTAFAKTATAGPADDDSVNPIVATMVSDVAEIAPVAVSTLRLPAAEEFVEAAQ